MVKKLMCNLKSVYNICDLFVISFFGPKRNNVNRDLPNGWAPVQHMIVEGLVNSGSKEARSLAEDIAVRWIRTNYAAYKKTGTMHEKYDVEKCGAFGGGGEYVPQVIINDRLDIFIILKFCLAYFVCV